MSDKQAFAAFTTPLPPHWETPEGAEMANTYADKSRDELVMSDVSDFALANAVFMADRGSLELIGLQTAAKERIRWLSVNLAIAQQALAMTSTIQAHGERVSDERLGEMLADIQSVINSSRLAGGAEYDIYPLEFQRALTELQSLRALSAAPEPIAEAVAWPGRQFCEIAERNVSRLAEWVKGEEHKKAASDAALAIRTLLASPPSPTPEGHFTIEYDGFAGDVIGHYTTREGKRGVVLQQDGTRVVHVYGEKWLKP